LRVVSLIRGTAGLAILVAIVGALPAHTQVDQVSALREGNRLFREGRVEEAHAAYLRGYDATLPHSVLFYNLGTTAQHLDRLPESILWYRRAESISPRDPWLQENLGAARDTLGLRPYAPPGFAGSISRSARTLFYLAAAMVWGGVLLWFIRSRHPLLIPMVLVVSGMVVYAGTMIATRWAPAPAVLISDCASGNGDLPAGSEIWIVRASTDTIDVAAGQLVLQCPLETAAPLLPR
jgi:hypothetical protein